MSNLFGPSSGGGSRIRGGGGLPVGVVDVLSPSRSGNPDVVADRDNSIVGPGMTARQAAKDNLVPDKNVDHTSLQANFTVSPASGAHPLAVQFTNTSTGAAIDSYLWDFGDGNTSALKSPAHSYANAGSYNVTLTIGRIGTYGPDRDISTKTVTAAVVAS